jgi:nucleotide-binding universal stress UspA family protein
MKRIVAALDFSNATVGVLELASSLAEVFGAELHLLHVVEPEPTYTAYGFTPDEFPAIHTFQEEARKRAKQKLDEAAAGLPGSLVSVVTELGEGSPLQALVDYVREKEADLVVLGSHGHGVVASLLIGSVAEGMVRKALIPTMVVPAPGKR